MEDGRQLLVIVPTDLPGVSCEEPVRLVALSASHTALSSIRMEPVFMVTSQSAATAACHAVDDGRAVQQVDYSKLRNQLLADGQVLTWPQTR